MCPSRTESWLVWSLRGCALVSASLVLGVLLFTLVEAWPALDTRLLSDTRWQPSAASPQFGTLPLLAGSLLVSAGALAVAAPIGLLAALFARFYAPRRLAGAFRRLLELLAGVPSVLFGFWGLVELVPRINRLHPPGQSLLAGSLVLALMVLPTIALTADAALANVPRAQLRAAASLGMGPWASLRGVILPQARAGIASGLVLATTRALGETMAVLMVCGNVVQLPGSPFDAVRTVTANIALEMGYAGEEHRAALFASGLLLLLLIAASLGLLELRKRPADA